MPKAIGYGRVSHAAQYAKGDSIEAQKERIYSYYETKLLPQGVEWHGWEEDGQARSAKISFQDRPAGKRIMKILEAGDHIIFDKLDRVWRSNKDFAVIADWFKSQNITIHIVNLLGLQVNQGEPFGDFAIRLLVSMAQLESDLIGARIRDSIAFLKQQGRFPLNTAPFGTQKVGTRENRDRRIVWHWEERRLASDLLEAWLAGIPLKELCTHANLRWYAISKKKMPHLVERRKFTKPRHVGYNILGAEIAYRSLRIQDASEVRNRELFTTIQAIKSTYECLPSIEFTKNLLSTVHFRDWAGDGLKRKILISDVALIRKELQESL